MSESSSSVSAAAVVSVAAGPPPPRTFAVSVTRGAGVSASGAPIQRTTSPFE